MTAMDQVKQGLHQVWSNVREGWQRLYHQAAGAMTRFRPGRHTGELSLPTEAWRSVGWGVLAAEVYDDDEHVIVEVEAPGMKRDDIDIEVVGNYLVIRGEKRYDKERKHGRYQVVERAYGEFERILPLPADVDASQAKAKYKRGVLKVELPKTSATQRKRVSVKAA